MSLSKAKTHQECQEFVEQQLKVGSLSIPAFFMDVYAKLTNLNLSWTNSVLKFRSSNREAREFLMRYLALY